MQKKSKDKVRPEQQQKRPGLESKMTPKPETKPENTFKKLEGKVALITGGDSGIGKATALLFAKEGAQVAITYLNETEDAQTTQNEIQEMGGECHIIKADLSKENACKKTIDSVLKKFNQLDILVNNVAMHWDRKSIEEISTEQLIKTFETNFYSYFWTTKYAVPHLKKGACIVNTTSVTAYRGSDSLIDYSATKGAIVSFTRSMAANLVEKGIRVNAVAPGPIWTPLIVSSFDEEKVAKFGSDSPMKRAGMPDEVAPCYLFLASEDSSFMSGQVLHPNGGEIVNG